MSCGGNDSEKNSNSDMNNQMQQWNPPAGVVELPHGVCVAPAQGVSFMVMAEGD